MSLLTFGPNGCLSSINKGIFEECKYMIDSLKKFENSSLKTSTQFVQGANKDELLQSIKKVHSESIETQLREKLGIIEVSTTSVGDFITILASANQDYYKSKSTIILHVSTMHNTGVKIYDCFIHSVFFELTTSTMQVLLFTIATVAITAVVVLTVGGKHSGTLAASMLGTGVAYAALNVRAHMPDFVDDALNLLMVESLKAKGLLIEIGNEYVLKTVCLATLTDSSICNSKVDSSERYES
mmetsp:Transcript_6278/g.8763  ORF Transcript_6278/g.8763 Transcript_6278/m.8763 type:complete len:241 (-) Transcript_6278:60-782(-)